MKPYTGLWQGWWEQPIGPGRQPIEAIHMAFDGVSLRGEGADMVGPFVMEGVSENGDVRLMKRYPQYNVAYYGKWNGEGAIVGKWWFPWVENHTDGLSNGNFAMWPHRTTPKGDAPITDIT